MHLNIDEFTFHIMNAMADDWESLDQIVPDIEQIFGSVDRSEVVRLLVRLVSEDLVQEMKIVKYESLISEMILKSPSRFWFTMTDKGRAFWDSEAPKYFDDNGTYPGRSGSRTGS